MLKLLRKYEITGDISKVIKNCLQKESRRKIVCNKMLRENIFAQKFLFATHLRLKKKMFVSKKRENKLFVIQ